MAEDNFLKMVKELQKKIESEEEKIYSKVVINEYRNPNYFGILKKPDAVGQIKGPCNDTMKFSLKIEKDKIKDARFWTDGCGATIASGNMLIKLIIGKTLQETKRITKNDLINELEGLPPEHLHCAKLAVNALHKSIENYEINK